MHYRHQLLLLVSTLFIYETNAKKQSLRQTIYSHSDTIVAPILAYPDDRACNQRCGYEYPGAPDTPHCCGRGDTAGTYFCCKYSTCCSLSYCCAPGYHCSEEGDMCTSIASHHSTCQLFFVLLVSIITFLGSNIL